MDLKQLLLTQGPKIALAAIAARQGGPANMSALLEGMQQAEMRKQQLARQQQLDQQAQETQQFNRSNIETDNARAEEAARMDRLHKALALIQQRAQLEGETATDPEIAQQGLQQTAQSAAGLYGVDPTQLTGMVPNLAPVISKRKQKQALERYEALKNIYGEEAVASDSITDNGELFKGMKPSQILALAQMGATDASGQPAAPYVRPTAASGRNLQSKEVMRGGQRVVVNFEPDTGKYFDLQGNEVTDIAPIPPASQLRPNDTPLIQVTDVDPVTGETVTSLVPRKPGEVSRRPPAEPNQSQYTAAGYATRIEQAEKVFDKVQDSIRNMSLLSFEAQTNSWFAKPTFQSNEVQSYMQGARNFINAVLRRESGAVIAPSEFEEAKQQYLPIPGDSEEAKALKAANRASVLENLRRSAGRAYQSPAGAPTGGHRIYYDSNGNEIQKK